MALTFYVITMERFTVCHSEGAKRPKNLAQDKLREEFVGTDLQVCPPLLRRDYHVVLLRMTPRNDTPLLGVTCPQVTQNGIKTFAGNDTSRHCEPEYIEGVAISFLSKWMSG